MDESVHDILHSISEDHWYYKLKFKLYEDFIVNRIKSLDHSKDCIVLDIGCGPGVFSKKLNSIGKIIGLDISLIELEHFMRNNAGMAGVCSDATKIPLKSNSIDFMVLSDMLEHIPEPEKVLSECSRILKKNGHIFINVPAFQILWGPHDELNHHQKRYSLKQLTNEISTTDLSIISKKYTLITLFFPLLIANQIKTIFGINSHNLKKPPEPINFLLYTLFKIEWILSKYLTPPFGINIFLEAKKP